MRKFLLTAFALLFIWTTLAQCFIMRNRMNDGKAKRIFEHKNIQISIQDTIIRARHMHYAITGDENLPTLVFIHGSPGSWMNYMKFMYDTSLRRQYRMMAIDRPGFGYSNFGQALSLQEQCDLILPVLKAQKGKQPMILFGHSMGGPVVSKLAAMDSFLFEKIYLVAAALDPQLEKKETWRWIMKDKPLYWLLPGAFGPSNTELLYLKKDLYPLQNDLPKITCPVHFIHGDQDSWVPIENVAYGYQHMNRARSLQSDTIQNGDHQLPWKNFEALKNILLSSKF